MKYTQSKDGVERTTVRLNLRFTREEIADIKRLAKAAKTTWRGWLESHVTMGIDEGLMETNGSMEQRYGRGGD